MLAEEYVETKRVGKYAVHIGHDDYGQQMFAEWIDEEGQAQTQSFYSYNINWEDNLIYYFRTKHWCDKGDCDKCDYKGEICERNDEMVDQRMRLSGRGIPITIIEDESKPLIIKGSIDFTPLEDALKSFKTETVCGLHSHKAD